MIAEGAHTTAPSAIVVQGRMLIKARKAKRSPGDVHPSRPWLVWSNTGPSGKFRYNGRKPRVPKGKTLAEVLVEQLEAQGAPTLKREKQWLQRLLSVEEVLRQERNHGADHEMVAALEDRTNAVRRKGLAELEAYREHRKKLRPRKRTAYEAEVAAASEANRGSRRGTAVTTPAWLQHELARQAAEAETRESERGEVRAAWMQLARDRRDWVRLADLRGALAHLPRKQLDRTLWRLYDARDINMHPEENAKTITDADRAAALRLGDTDVHLVRWRGM